MSKSKLGRNPLAPKKAASVAAPAPRRIKTPARPDRYRSSMSGFLSNLATAALAETVLFGLRGILLVRTTLFSRRAH